MDHTATNNVEESVSHIREQPLAKSGKVCCLDLSVTNLDIAGELRVCDAETGRTLRTLPIAVRSYDGDGIAFTRDGTRLAVSSGDGAIKLWDWDTPSGREARSVRFG